MKCFDRMPEKFDCTGLARPITSSARRCLPVSFKVSSIGAEEVIDVLNTLVLPTGLHARTQVLDKERLFR